MNAVNMNVKIPKDLPIDAQSLFEKTYKKTMEGFEALEEIKGIKNVEKRKETAIELAWQEIKNKYKKQNKTWIKK